MAPTSKSPTLPKLDIATTSTKNANNPPADSPSTSSSSDADRYKTPEAIRSPTLDTKMLSPPPVSTLFTEARAQNPKVCVICGVKAESTCPECHGVFYCSVEHKQQDEYFHGIICDAIKEIPPRPEGKNWICVLVFPEYTSIPYFQWVQYYENKHGFPAFDQSPWYGKDYQSIPGFITHHPVNRGILGNMIMFFQRQQGPPPTDRYSTANICIHNLTGGVNARAYQGHMLLVGQGNESNTGKEWFLSFLPSDLSCAIEHLKLPRTAVSRPVERVESIKGVTIYPWTSQHDGSKAIRVIPIDVPANHPIFNDKDDRVAVSPIGAAYGFPLRGFFYEHWIGATGNHLAHDLFREVEQTKTRVSMGESYFKSIELGGIILVRSDKRALEAEQIEIYRAFIGHLEVLWNEYNQFVKQYPEGTRANNGEVFEYEVDVTSRFGASLDPCAFLKFWEMKAIGLDCASPFSEKEYKACNVPQLSRIQSSVTRR